MPRRMLMHISSEELKMDPDSDIQVQLSAPVKLWALILVNLQQWFSLLLVFVVFFNTQVFLL